MKSSVRTKHQQTDFPKVIHRFVHSGTQGQGCLFREECMFPDSLRQRLHGMVVILLPKSTTGLCRIRMSIRRGESRGWHVRLSARRSSTAGEDGVSVSCPSEPGSDHYRVDGTAQHLREFRFRLIDIQAFGQGPGETCNHAVVFAEPTVSLFPAVSPR